MGILQARILEWVAISHSRGSFWSKDRNWVSGVSFISRWILYHWRILYHSCGKHHSWHRIIPGTSIFKTNWHHEVQSVTSPSRVSWNPQVSAHAHCPRLSWRPSQPLCYVNLCWGSTVCTLHSDPFSTHLCSAGCITQGPWAYRLLLSWPLVGLGRRSGNRREIQCSYSHSSLPAGSFSSRTTVPTRWPSSAAPSRPRLQEWHSLLPLPLQL